MRSLAQSQDPCLLVLELDLQIEIQSDFDSPSLPPLSHIYTRESLLTCLVGSSACVAAATAAAQAGAALVQTVSHQTWDGPSFRTLIYIMCGQHMLIQTGWEATTTLSLFILQNEVR